MHMTTRHDILTSHGRIAVETKGQGFPVVFIHGNSACRHVFRKQVMSSLFTGYKLITFDLPGHGDSDDALDPAQTYTRSGLAGLVAELLGELDVHEAAIIGASLGGHIAIEMLAHSEIPRGLFLMGTPAVGLNMAEGFIGKPMNGLASQRELTSKEAERFARTVFGAEFETFIPKTIMRTDREFRNTLFSGASRGNGINQREMLMGINILTAIVNGEDDSIVNLDYIDSVPYANLWRGTCIRVPNASHSPFWEAPEVTNHLLFQFLQDLDGRNM